MTEPAVERLTMYTLPAELPLLEWAWAEGVLESAGTYWVVSSTAGHPHPRPVWGVWDQDRLHLSIGSPPLRRAARSNGPVAVHVDGSNDVVIVEGTFAGASHDPAVVARYDRKYDWEYAVDQYGAFAVVEPERVLAWRSAGPAGREGFTHAARWTF